MDIGRTWSFAPPSSPLVEVAYCKRSAADVEELNKQELWSFSFKVVKTALDGLNVY